MKNIAIILGYLPLFDNALTEAKIYNNLLLDIEGLAETFDLIGGNYDPRYHQ